MKLNSVIFHTNNLDEIRVFYEGKLGFPTGTYKKDGKTLPDYSESYVNYHIDGGLLCFENDGDRIDLGAVVIKTSNFTKLRDKLNSQGIDILGGNDFWLKINDPDGRTIIFEPSES